MFLLSLCLILPCTFLFTACGEDNNTPPTSPSNNSTSFTIKESTYGINFTTVDCTTFEADEPCDELFDFSESCDVAVWVADYLDKDTLKICLNEDELDLTPLTVDDDYTTRNLSTRFRKIATFTWDVGRMKSPGENELIVTVDEVEIDINFVSNGQTFTDEEKAILDDWCITDAGGQSLLSLMDSNQSLKITYRKLVDYYLEVSVEEDDGHTYCDSDIRYTCKKPMGYYVEDYFFKMVDPQLYIGHIENQKQTIRISLSQFIVWERAIMSSLCQRILMLHLIKINFVWQNLLLVELVHSIIAKFYLYIMVIPKLVSTILGTQQMRMILKYI